MINKSKKMITLLILSTFISGALYPIVDADKTDYVIGYDKGVSYTNVVPLEKVTMVNYDENSYNDDLAYLAAVPTAVFHDQNPKENRLFSFPLLFYQDEFKYEEDKDRSLNAYQGLDYFMQDWMKYCDSELDQMTLINVPQSKVDHWGSAKEYTIIEEQDPYEIAVKLATNDWAYSDNAVVAVIGEEFNKPENIVDSEVTGTLLDGKEIINITKKTDQLDKVNPRPHFFDVPDGYKYFKARTWWASIWFGTPKESDLPISLNVTIPAADPDSQFYCKYNDDWMEVAATQGWNIEGMDRERAESYIYTSGQWKLTITDIPTFGDKFGSYGSFKEILSNMLTKATYQTDIWLYPGTDVVIPEMPSFGSRNATFKLTWDDPTVTLGFSLIGQYGEEILSSNEENAKSQEIKIEQIGEYLKGKHYSISVFTMDELTKPVDFKVEYCWEQNYSKEEGCALASATEGAILASQMNAPLLYISSNSLPKATKDALYKLGVENIYLVDIGKYSSSKIMNELENIAQIKVTYNDLFDIYDKIMDLTGQNDFIFSTIDPWTKWYVAELKPAEQTKAGLFIGPAAYSAAHHGSPVLLVDMHPELSNAVVWHREFWQRHCKGQPHPTVAPIFLTASNVMKFLIEHGFDKEGIETMLTIAGQFEIGATWDRAFVGNANAGRIFGCPVDTAYWISRSIFYPALIFNNPGMSPYGVTMEQGSYSERRKLFPWGKFGLKIVKPNKDENFKYPVLQMYITYSHRQNEMALNYYGYEYETADNIIPGKSLSTNAIDNGAVPGVEGQLWPDLSDSEVPPFYLTKGGYSNVYTTNFNVLVENLNAGALMFILDTHGTGAGSGILFSWNPKYSDLGIVFKGKLFAYQKETNPWRGYDWYLGSTANPDTMTMEVHGLIPALFGNPNWNGLFPLGEDFWPSERPILHAITNLPIIRLFMPDWIKSSDYYKDGMIGSHTISGYAVEAVSFTGYNLDDKLDNMYSCGVINTACLPAYKYLHLTMIRHGSSFQIIDPWSTSWYSYWVSTIPRDIVLGDTIGEAYGKGIGHVGILYATDPPRWWWDIAQNVCFFGDPDLRPFVPENDFSTANTWAKEETAAMRYDSTIDINGHMPYGATNYPNEKEPQLFLPLWLIIIIIIVLLLIIYIAATGRMKRKI